MFVEYLIAGIKHVLPLGLDHVLFIIALCLSTDRFKSALILATLFTIAHSITLAIGYFNVASYNQRLIEVLIAISIFILAIQNTLPNSSDKFKPWVVFGFGLIHGLGFSSALKEYGLIKNDLIISLAGFNIGVEIAQVIIILVVSIILFMLDKYNWAAVAKKYSSFVIAIIALIWTFQRLNTL